MFRHNYFKLRIAVVFCYLGIFQLTIAYQAPLPPADDKSLTFNEITQVDSFYEQNGDLEVYKLVSDNSDLTRRNNNLGPVSFSSIFNRFSNRKLSEEEEHSLEEELSVEVAEQDIYKTLIFLITVFALGKIATFVGMPSLVGEIIAGFLLGPPLAKFVPFPEAFVLVGEIGLVALVLEAGIDLDIAQLKETGGRSFLIAVVGTVMPWALGFGLTLAQGATFRTAIAVGAAFSPTSLGVASNALSAGGVLNTPVGQLIVAACVIDDVFGLIFLSMLGVLVNPDAALYEYFIPFISAFGFLIVLGWFGLTLFPRFIEKTVLPHIPASQRDIAAFAMMLLLLMGYMPLFYYTQASYLTGAFLAGLSFSQIHSIHSTFIYQTQNLMKWLLRIFFSASIGFQIPITMFWSGRIIGWGFIFYSCVLIKCLVGFLAPNSSTDENMPYNARLRDGLIVGFAMSCRGEFSFIIASFALGSGLFDAELYSIIVWAILLSCITSPFFLIYTIKYYNNKSLAAMDKIEEMHKKSGEVPLYLVIQCRSGLKWGLQQQLVQCASSLGLTIIDHRSWHPRGLDAVAVSELYVQDNKINVTMRQKDLTYLNVSGTNDEETPLTSVPEGEERIESEKLKVSQRCEDIQKAMMEVIDQDSAKVVVIQWMPSALDETVDAVNFPIESLHNQIKHQASILLKRDETIDTLVDERPAPRQKMLSGPITVVKDESGDGEVRNEQMPESPSILRRRQQRSRTTSVPVYSSRGLWDDDHDTQMPSITGAPMSATVVYDLSTPSYGTARRRRQSSESPDFFGGALPTVEEQLEGIVRSDRSDTRR
mmetsp:Transcript_12582/g.15482  ORF Transcript_12582/g.15482 Transcript_12582/m.15482 type:complete len:820 (-) Transcript_12582:1380-3839(-)